MVQTLGIGLILAVLSLVLWIGISMVVRALFRAMSRAKKPSHTLVGLPNGVWFAASLLSALTLGQQSSKRGADGSLIAASDIGVTIFILVAVTLLVRLCIRLARARRRPTGQQQQR
ncbi:hypothetical protein [Pseudonocardia spinosispora]|uniref:hypothetical protein n=1 Tax=Pseudonocardia spinosispora TaxID=103441 RepID=UPI0003FBC13F|nr:hypothetical protein [Pseudonocardia spinosispora]